MRADFLKIAGVKSEAEFYKKFPSEKAFMKKHGKALKKLKAKKAQVGAMIPNIETPETNVQPIRIDNDFMNDQVARLTGGKSTQQKKADELYQASLAAAQQTANPKSSGGGLGGMLGQLGGMFGGAASGGGDTSQFSQFNNADLSGLGDGALQGPPSFKSGGSFKAHKMYDSKGKSKMAKTLKEHLALKKKGWGHDAPKAQFGSQSGSNFGGVDTNILDLDGNPINTSGGFGDVMNSGAVQNFGVPILNDAIEISGEIKAQKEALGLAKQNRQVSDIALQASKTTPEKVDRSYVRPEDFINTGEEFFPIYGVGTNALAKHGGAYKAQDGGMFNGKYMPLVNPNQQKVFGQGGYLRQAQGGVSYGGGMAGSAGTQFAGMLGVNDDAGSKIGGKIGGTIGSAFGPVGSFVGSTIGSAAGDLLDRNDRRQRIENDATARNTKEMMYGAVAPSIQAGYSSHVKNGGNVPSYRSGGNMRGNYVSPNPSALDTMKMGGNLKTLWGGEANTVSYNPYAGGESIQFKGNSHEYRDPQTGQTGIGVAYGDDAKQMSMGGDITANASVEVENEPAQEINNELVVYGDMKIPKEYISEIGDERAKGKKFKNYVSGVLNKDEAKINRRQEKVADIGLESDDTVFGQLERITADMVLQGSDMKLKSIAEKKSVLADLQNAMNETFDDYGIKANEFLNKGKMVKDPMRMENSEIAKDGKDVPKAQNNITGNVSNNDFNKTRKTPKTEEQLIKEGYVQDPDNPLRFTKGTDAVIATEASGSSLGSTPEGQSIDSNTDFAGGVTMEQVSEIEEGNPWFGKFDFTKPKVKHMGKMIHPDVLRFQQEFNERVKGTDIAPIELLDGILGKEVSGARFTAGVEAKEATTDEIILEDTKTTDETTTVAPVSNIAPMVNFDNTPEDMTLDNNQLLGEYYAMATNQVQPVQAQGFQPQLRTPYDISLQDMRNDVTSQSRAMQRNATLQNNPAALALSQAPTYDALNKINAEEFRQNQAMKDNVYSGNQAILNDANLKNLGIYDQQADRQAQAASNTRTQNIDILSSISDKYSQTKRDNALNKVYANMYPTFKFDKNSRANVVNPTQFNTGQGMTGTNPLSIMQGFTGGNELNNGIGIGNYVGGLLKNKEEKVEKSKYGKKVTKNNKNSNILREMRNL